jgi:hypothetical protein
VSITCLATSIFHACWHVCLRSHSLTLLDLLFGGDGCSAGWCTLASRPSCTWSTWRIRTHPAAWPLVAVNSRRLVIHLRLLNHAFSQPMFCIVLSARPRRHRDGMQLHNAAYSCSASIYIYIRAPLHLKGDDVCNFLNTCRMTTPLRGCKAPSICTNISGLHPMGWS